MTSSISPVLAAAPSLTSMSLSSEPQLSLVLSTSSSDSELLPQYFEISSLLSIRLFSPKFPQELPQLTLIQLDYDAMLDLPQMSTKLVQYVVPTMQIFLSADFLFFPRLF